MNRKTGNRQFVRRYFIACEGFTELEYLLGIKNHRKCPSINIKKDIDIQLLNRFDQDSGLSNPTTVVALMEDYRILVRDGQYTTALFVSTIVQQIFDKYFKELEGSKKTEKKRDLRHLQKDMIKELNTSDYCDGHFIKDCCWEEATEFCRKAMVEKGYRGMAEYLDVPKGRKSESYDEQTDIFCLIADRDAKSNPTKKYLELLQICNNQKIRLCISNPCFEFWLLLHTDRCMKYKEEETILLENSKDESGKTFAERELEIIFGCYSKMDIHFEKNYLYNVKKAVENSQSFAIGLEELECHLGSNVGELLSELIGKNDN